MRGKACAAALRLKNKMPIQRKKCVMLFPFNGGGWLGADVVGDAIDAAHLVDDAVGYFG